MHAYRAIQAVWLRYGRQEPLPCRPLIVMAVSLAGGCAVSLSAGFAGGCGVTLPAGFWWAVGIALLGGWLWCHLTGRHRAAAVALTAVVFCGGAAWARARFDFFASDDVAWQLDERPQPVAIEGIVVTAPRSLPQSQADRFGAAPSGSSECVVRVTRVRARSQWRAASGQVAVIVDGDPPQVPPGSRIRAFGRGLRPAAAGNPGEFDFRERARARRCLAIVRVRSAVAIRRMRPQASPSAVMADSRSARVIGSLRTAVAAGIEGVRRWSADTLARHISPAQLPLATALLLGSRESLPRDQIDAFLATGTVHLLAISGLHVGLLAAGVYRLLRCVLVPRGWALAGVAVGAGLYMLLVRAETPVVRATLVVWLAAAAAGIGRRSPGLNALAFAALILLIWRPAEIASVGAQLSFLSTAVLIGVAHAMAASRQQPDPIERLIERSRPRAERWLRRVGRQTVVVLVAGAAVWAVTAPLVVARFHVVSPLGIVLNVIVTPLVAAAMGCGLGCLVLAPVAPLASGCGMACDAALAAIEACVAWGARVPWGHVWLPTPPGWWVWGWYAWLLAACLLLPAVRLRQPRTWLVVAALWCGIGLVGTPALRLLTPAAPCLRVIVAAVGHGCGIVIRTPTGRTLLYDAGRLGGPAAARRAVAGVLWDEGVSRIDSLVISHADTDHFNAVPGLLERFAVGEIVVPPAFVESRSRCVRELLGQAAAARVPIRVVRPGDTFALDRHCRVDVLRAGERRWMQDWRAADNESSLVLSVELLQQSAVELPQQRAGERRSEAAGRRLLLTGDLEGRALADFLASGPPTCDVLLAPHHGTLSSMPPHIARATRPEWIVVSGRGGLSWDKVHAAYEAARAEGAGAHMGGVLNTGGEGAIRFHLAATGVEVARY